MKKALLACLVMMLALSFVAFEGYGKSFNQVELLRLIDSPKTKLILTGGIVAAIGKSGEATSHRAPLLEFYPETAAFDSFSDIQMAVTIDFLFIPLDKYGTASFLYEWRWPWPIPILVERSFWFWGTEVGGEISEDTTWTLDGSPYYVIDNVSVQSGVTLVIEPGAQIRFRKFTDSRNNISFNIYGSIIAQGTEENFITFTTSCNFEDLDQTQGESSLELGRDFLPTDWTEIYIEGESAIFDYCVVEYGDTNVYLSGSTTSQIYISVIRGSVTGIVASNAIIIDNIIEKNGFSAIDAKGNVTISRNNITARYSHGWIHITGQDNEIIENSFSIEEIPGTFVAWGIMCRFGSSSTIFGNTIIGTGSNGIDITDEGTTANITYNQITGCSSGIFVGFFSPGVAACTVNYNCIYGNGYGVYNNDCGMTVNVENNYWGHESGPYHPETNPDGQGDAVSDCVDFEPWLTECSLD